MGVLRRTINATMVGLLIAACIASETDAAELDSIGDDGWYTWQAQAVNDAPNMCCISWNMGRPRSQVCDLDHDNGNNSSIDDQFNISDTIQMYVRMDDGKVRRIRTLNPQCAITTRSHITDLGLIESENSVEWLNAQLSAGKRLSSDAVTAIAMHGGDAARQSLERAARSHPNDDTREEAVFWMAQVRINEMGDVVKDIMYNDKDTDMREHAVFAYSQSEATDIIETITKLGTDDRDPEIRSQAWFWLAQSEADGVEDIILEAVRRDPDGEVREEAVFALSQLPEEQAVKALAKVLEDKRLDKDTREQALFWLAQSDSDEAYEYVDRLLTSK